MAVLLSSAVGVFSLLQNVQAGTPIFTYGDRDLVLSFRKDTAPSDLSSVDLEVDIGPATNYYGAAIGSVTEVDQSGTYLASLLNSTFNDLNNLSWSVVGCVPYASDGAIASIQFNAAQFSSGIAQGPTNTGRALVITAGNTASSESCDYFLGTLGNMKGTFQGDVENTTQPDFSSNPLSQPSRSDFFQLNPQPFGSNPAGACQCRSRP